jgi:hypothetical protein
MRERQTIQTTLGDFIVAVTDEVGPLTDSPGSTYIIVSLILQDLFAHRRVRLNKVNKRLARLRRS